MSLAFGYSLHLFLFRLLFQNELVDLRDLLIAV